MIPKDLQALIARLEILAKKQISGALLGDARSVRIGSGFEFHQLRDYIPGDDIRFIDWKASARSHKMLVREYHEDRNRHVYLAVDLSQSMRFGTVGMLDKLNLIKQLSGVLAFVSLQCGDSVGLILFTDTIEKVIPPRPSRNHIISLLNTLYTFTPTQKKTDFDAPCEYFARMKSQKSLICLISDFMSSLDSCERLLATVARRHDVIAFRCLDPREHHFPDVGTLIFEDSESQMQATIACLKARDVDQVLAMWHGAQKERLRAARIDCLDIEVGTSYSAKLAHFLRYRAFRD
jgi:uncharacterized protein (DUF58 family)